MEILVFSSYRSVLYACALALILTGVRAKADAIVFNDLGTGNTYNCCNGWNATGTSFFLGLTETAASFTPASNATLGQIDVALTSEPGSSSSVSVSLETNNHGLPGTVIESWNLTGPFPTIASTNDIVQTLFPTMTISLSGGTQYWLVEAPLASNTVVVWNFSNTQPTPGTTTEYYSGGAWTNEGSGGAAFEVLSTPEPNSVMLLSIGLLGIAFTTPKRRPRSGGQ